MQGLFLILGAVVAAGAQAGEVVIYTAHDETYSAPILEAFEQETGIRAKAVYDTESSKTTGLVNRLIAEKARPRADVFWNNEVAQTIVLKQKGVLAPHHSAATEAIPAAFRDPEQYWTGFAARGRVIIYNTELVKEPPRSILDFTRPAWRGHVGIALPLFGTTATHAAALFALWGDEKARRFFQELKANDVEILAGNATVRDMVAQGELKAGLTDTDDANGAVVDGRPARWLFPDQGAGEIGTLIIPNSVCLIAGGPNPENGKKLIDFLLSPAIEARLARSRSLQIPLNPAVEAPEAVPKLGAVKTMAVTFAEAAARMASTARFIQDEFAR